MNLAALAMGEINEWKVNILDPILLRDGVSPGECDDYLVRKLFITNKAIGIGRFAVKDFCFYMGRTFTSVACPFLDFTILEGGISAICCAAESNLTFCGRKSKNCLIESTNTVEEQSCSE